MRTVSVLLLLLMGFGHVQAQDCPGGVCPVPSGMQSSGFQPAPVAAGPVARVATAPIRFVSLVRPANRTAVDTVVSRTVRVEVRSSHEIRHPLRSVIRGVRHRSRVAISRVGSAVASVALRKPVRTKTRNLISALRPRNIRTALRNVACR